MGLTRLFLAQRGLCFHCRKPMLYAMANDKNKNPNRYNREHIIPRSKGGGHGTNIVLAHARCNRDRKNTPPTENMIWRAQQIWAMAVTFTGYQVEQFTKDASAVGTYCSGYKWPSAGGKVEFDPATARLRP